MRPHDEIVRCGSSCENIQALSFVMRCDDDNAARPKSIVVEFGCLVVGSARGPACWKSGVGQGNKISESLKHWDSGLNGPLLMHFRLSLYDVAMLSTIIVLG